MSCTCIHQSNVWLLHRAGSGESFFGGLFGKSSTAPPARPNSRIDFQFDKVTELTFSVWISAFKSESLSNLLEPAQASA